MAEKVPHVVVLGGGFAGLAATRRLKRAPVRVTLVDQSNHHLFQPLLYQVATAALTAPDIATPLRKVLRRQPNTTVLMSRVVDVDVARRRVVLEHGELAYDYLLVATGMTNNYFGHAEWEEHAPGLKTLHEALDIRARMLRAYEAAERESDPEKRKELLTFVIIGGGPTGVEMAGALAEIASRTLARDFRNFDPARETRVILIEGLPRLLAAFSADSSSYAKQTLEELGCEVRLGTMVRRVDAHGVVIDGERIDAGTIVWAAGLKASPITASLGAPLDRLGRVQVQPDLTVPGHPEVYVLGDLIHLEQDGELLPGVAPLAIQSGRCAAEQIENEVLGYPKRERFVYRDKGSMATIGRAKAVAERGRQHFSGFFAFILWLLVHIAFLIDLRNRVAVMLEWAYAYFTWRRSARVILEAPLRCFPSGPGRHDELGRSDASQHARAFAGVCGSRLPAGRDRSMRERQRVFVVCAAVPAKLAILIGTVAAAGVVLVAGRVLLPSRPGPAVGSPVSARMGGRRGGGRGARARPPSHEPGAASLRGLRRS